MTLKSEAFVRVDGHWDMDIKLAPWTKLDIRILSEYTKIREFWRFTLCDIMKIRHILYSNQSGAASDR